jgi:hypothetical protein
MTAHLRQLSGGRPDAAAAGDAEVPHVEAPPAGPASQLRDDLRQALRRYRPLVLTAVRWRWALVGLAALMSVPLRIIAQADPLLFARGGTQILTGRLSEVYADPVMQGGPFELLASLLMLPLPEQRQTPFILRSDVALIPVHAVGAAIVMAVALLGVRQLRRVLDLPPSGAVELAVGLVVLVILARGWLWWGGHAAQVVIPFFWICGAALAVRGRMIGAAVVLGLSAGWEPWGVLAAPLLLLELLGPADAEHRRPARLVGACAVFTVAAVAPYLPFILTGRFALFELSWPITPGTLVHTLWPDLDAFSWWLRCLQGGATVLAGSVVVLIVGRRRDVVWLAPSAIVAARLLFDPCNYFYYWFPLLVLCCAGLALADGTRPRWRWDLWHWVLFAGVAAIPLLKYLALARWTSTPIGLALLLALLVALAARQRMCAPLSAPARTRYGLGLPKLR